MEVAGDDVFEEGGRRVGFWGGQGLDDLGVERKDKIREEEDEEEGC